jgi:hypothetical protein
MDINDLFQLSRRIKMNKFISTILFGSAFAFTFTVALPAGAHTEEYFDSKESTHGGQTRMAGPYHLELVVKDKEIILYVMDHADRNLSTEGGAGKATVQIGKAKNKTSVKLEPAGNNMLKGTGDFVVSPEAVVTVFVELPEQEVTAARFTPLKFKSKTTKASNGKPVADGQGASASAF